MSARLERFAPVAAVALAVWSLVPLALWWDNATLEYFTRAWQTWAWGTLVALLAAVLLLVLSKGRVVRLLPAVWQHIRAVPAGLFVGAVMLLLAVESLLMTLLVFAGNPRNVDGFAQLFQARLFLAGHVWVPPPAELASFGTLQMIVGPERWYAQYPPGQPAVLAAGLSLGAWWALNPLFVALFTAATWRVARWCCDEATARLALLVLCLSPFVVAVAGSEMSHLPAATLGMGAAALATFAADRGRAGPAALAGLLLGLMTAFRPLDAVAAAVPVAVILLGNAPRRAALFAAAGIAGVAGTVPTLLYNAATTGSWRTFGYTALWGPDHSLGFHPVPFGVPLTLSRAVARVGTDLHQLNTYLLDTTFPVLLVVAAGYVAGRRLLQARDQLPFVASLTLLALLFCYWHRDVFYGPRFLYSVVAWLVIIVARSLVLLRRSAPRLDEAGMDRGLVAAFVVVVALLTGLVTITPGRIEAYRLSTPVFSLHPDRDAARAGIHNAVVVIPDGWGSRLIARLWAAGIPVHRSSRLYAAIDACTLEQLLARAESTQTGPDALMRGLEATAALRRPGFAANLTADRNLRLQPGELAPVCRQEVEVDRRGFYQFGPWLWLNTVQLDGDVVWARDLGPGNAALFRRYAGRRFYRYAPDADGRPVLMPLERPSW